MIAGGSGGGERPAVFTKLNLKEHDAIVVLGAPASFDVALAELVDVRVARRVPAGSVAFAIAFATTRRHVNGIATKLAPNVVGDGILWVAYPKRSSPRLHCEFDRDTGWGPLGEAGFEPVRQVAIDDDWTALRFRRVEYIPTMTRSFAMTEAGRAKAAKAVKGAARRRPS